jgi:hypothetical protein
MSTLNVDKVDPSTGTALELGTSGDTITVPTGAGLTVVDEVKTNKVSPATGTAFALGDSGDTFTVPSGATIVNSGTATGFGITAANFRPNAQAIIINGNMDISQRGTAIADESTSGVYRVDRMNIGMSSMGEVRLQQETLTSGNAFDNGFTEAFRIDCQVADASPAAGDILNMTYKLEGNSVQAFKKGTSNAEKFTLAFWVKSNKTVTAQVNLVDGDNSRMCSATYAVSSGDTWEHKVLNFAADTTGAFDNDNAKSLEIEFALDAGSDFTSGAVPTAWEASANADRSVEDFALQDNTSNDWAITGLQLEVGEYTSSTLPPFQFETFGDNLERCCRYYQTCENFTGVANDTNYFLGNAPKQFRMRIDNPTLGNPTTLQITDFYSADLSQTSTGTISSLCDAPDKLLLYLGGFGGALTQGRAYGGTRNNANDNHITMDAEL